MGHAHALKAPEQHKEHEAAESESLAPAPNTYGGRISPNLDLPTRPIDVAALRRFFRNMRRRRRAELPRVACDVADAILADTNVGTGRCDASTMGLITRAGCARSSFFEYARLFEGLGLMEVRQQIDPNFAACTNTIARGWKGFHACQRMRAAAELEGRPFTCIAHHGRTVIAWKAQTTEDAEIALQDREPAPVRRRRYRTPTTSGSRTREIQEACRTPHPGSGAEEEAEDKSSASSLSAPRGRRASADERAAAPSARRGPSSGPSGHVAPDGARFAQPALADEEHEGGRALGVPDVPLSHDVEAVIAAERARDGTTLERTPASRFECAVVARELARGWRVEELVAIIRGIALLEHDHGRSIASWAGRDERMQRALDAWRAHERERERVEAARGARAAAAAASSAAARGHAIAVPIVDQRALERDAIAARLAEATAEANAACAAMTAAFGRPEFAAKERAYQAALERLRQLHGKETRR